MLGARSRIEDLRAYTQSAPLQAAALLILGLILLLLAWGKPVGARFTLAVSGMVLLMLGVLAAGVFLWNRQGDHRLARRLDRIVGFEAAACFATDPLGQIVFRNQAAETRFGAKSEQSLAQMLQAYVATPQALLLRLQARAEATGFSREDSLTGRGLMRIAVHQLTSDRFFWRIEEFDERIVGRGAEGLSLPMLTANRSGIILFSNEAFRRLIGGRPKRLDAVFASQRLINGEEVVVKGADGPIHALVAHLEGAGDRREIYLLPLPQGGGAAAAVDFETVPVPLMKFTREARLHLANRAARDLLGELISDGCAFHNLFEELGRPVDDWLSDVIEERLPPGTEMLRLRREGEEGFVQLQLRRIVEGGRVFALAILSDVTELKRMEARFGQSQKMMAMGQLAGGIAHDFNNLLTAIAGHCDLLLLRHGREDSDYADLEQIRQNANRAASLVNQLLAFSRKQTLKPDYLDLTDVVGETMHLLNRLIGERMVLEVKPAPEIGLVRADRRRLEQVLMNLVVNARDSYKNFGRIVISTEALVIDSPKTRDRVTLPKGRYAVIRVQDFGCGIAADKIDKIFDPFFTTKRAGEGTGLGLATVYGIVKQSGGYIFVESEPDVGTTFEVLLPVHEAPDGALPVKQEEPKPLTLRSDGGTVLLVEDEAAVRAFASRALRLRGYSVFEAESGEKALAMLENTSLKIDVFVTDVVMPGLDGPSWVKRALETRPEARVVFVSGYAEDHLSADQAEIPKSTFLAKPFSLNDLSMVVQQQLS